MREVKKMPSTWAAIHTYRVRMRDQGWRDGLGSHYRGLWIPDNEFVFYLDWQIRGWHDQRSISGRITGRNTRIDLVSKKSNRTVHMRI